MILWTLLSNIFFIGIGLLGISFLIGFHELGHFMFCKLFSIPAPSFSIGIGPRIWQKKIGETVFAVSAIPFGGYVEIGEEAGPSPKDIPFRYRPYYQKLLVMCGGILCNLFFAYAAFTILFILGVPKTPLFYPRNALTTISAVEAHSPAAQAGLMPQDTIITVEGVPVKTFSDLLQSLNQYKDSRVSLTIKRAGGLKTIPVQLSSHETAHGKVGYLGITPELTELEPLSFFAAVTEATSVTNQLIAQSFMAFISVAKRRSTEGLGGPLMLISATRKVAQQGTKLLIMLLAFISINLAVLNVLPLPVLDGGQVLLATIESLLRRPISDTIRWYIFVTCWLALLLLMIYLSINDIRLIFGS